MNRLNKFIYFQDRRIQEWASCICCLGMIAGLFYSRALLSMSMIGMFLNALHPQMIKEHWILWRKNKFALFSLAFFCTYLLSGMWSEDKGYWWNNIINKLPFLILPFAFIGAPLQKHKFRKIIIVCLLLMQLSIIFYSLGHLISNPDYYIQGYDYSRSLPTTKYDDHIRFSLSLVLSLLMSFYLLFERQSLSNLLKAFLIFCIIVFIIYIHILAAKTGLLCLYMMVFLYIFFKLGHYSRLWSAVLLLLLFLIPITAYFSLKTFRSKVHYVIYEVQQWKSQKQFDYNLSDAGRLISYKMGLAIIEHHPVSGVGAGDVRTAMKEQYNSSRPDVPEENILVPHNQFLYTALAVGIPFMILLVFMVVAPFFTRSDNSLYLSITSFILWVAMMVEAMLEIQFGIFVYLFFILFWMAALKKTGYDVQEAIKIP